MPYKNPSPPSTKEDHLLSLKILSPIVVMSRSVVREGSVIVCWFLCQWMDILLWLFDGANTFLVHSVVNTCLFAKLLSPTYKRLCLVGRCLFTFTMVLYWLQSYSEVDHTSVRVLYIRLIILLTDTILIASSRRSYDNMIFARGASQSKIEHPYFNLIVSASSSWEPSPIIVLFS